MEIIRPFPTHLPPGTVFDTFDQWVGIQNQLRSQRIMLHTARAALARELEAEIIQKQDLSARFEQEFASMEPEQLCERLAEYECRLEDTARGLGPQEQARLVYRSDIRDIRDRCFGVMSLLGHDAAAETFTLTVEDGGLSRGDRPDLVA